MRYKVKSKELSKKIFKIGIITMFVLSSSITLAEISNNSMKSSTKASPKSGSTHQLVDHSIDQKQIILTINGKRYVALLEENIATKKLLQMLPLTLKMADYNSNEKHAPLPQSLPTIAQSPKRIEQGDLMLFGDRTIVLFYRSFDTEYRYTRLGKVELPNDFEQQFGHSTVIIEFSL